MLQIILYLFLTICTTIFILFNQPMYLNYAKHILIILKMLTLRYHDWFIYLNHILELIWHSSNLFAKIHLVVDGIIISFSIYFVLIKMTNSNTSIFSIFSIYTTSQLQVFSQRQRHWILLMSTVVLHLTLSPSINAQQYSYSPYRRQVGSKYRDWKIFYLCFILNCDGKEIFLS